MWLRAHQLGPLPAELTSLPDVDWAGFGVSLGCRGETVRDPNDLAAVYTRALESAEPTVIDVKTDKQFPSPVRDWAAAIAAWSYHE